MGDEHELKSDPILEKQDTDDGVSATSTTPAPPLLKVTSTSDSIRIVVQRFRQCTLLVHDTAVTVGESSSASSSLVEPSSTSTTTVSSSGMLAYISFATLATKEKTLAAAKMLVHLPVLTMGAWGDGSETRSVLDMASLSSSSTTTTTTAVGGAVNVVLVPQANVICKVRSQGKSIQYHGQIDKRQGKVLYELFVDYVKALCLEHQCNTRNQSVPKFVTSLLNPPTNSVDASTQPSEMFRDWTLYSAWDDHGLPLTDSSGQPLTKSATKKCKKLMEVHAKKHQKHLNRRSGDPVHPEELLDWTLLDERTFIRIVAGIYGARQALEMSSDMGPFCHVVSL